MADSTVADPNYFMKALETIVALGVALGSYVGLSKGKKVKTEESAISAEDIRNIVQTVVQVELQELETSLNFRDQELRATIQRKLSGYHTRIKQLEGAHRNPGNGASDEW